MITISLIDDEQLFLEGLKQVINRQENLQVLNCYSNSPQFVERWATEEKPDVVLVDMNIPDIDGPQLTQFIREQSPEVKVIGLSSHYTKSLVFKMLNLGASSYLPKNVSIDRLAKTIDKVHSEGFYFEEFRLTRSNWNSLDEKEQKELLFHGLTEREVEVLKLICEQCTTAEISNRLFISNKTVERHRTNLFFKTKSKNVVGLALFALKYQLVEREYV